MPPIYSPINKISYYFREAFVLPNTYQYGEWVGKEAFGKKVHYIFMGLFINSTTANGEVFSKNSSFWQTFFNFGGF